MIARPGPRWQKAIQGTELNNHIILAIVACLLFAFFLYLIDKIAGFLGLKLPEFLRYTLAIVLVFSGIHTWQTLPNEYIPRLNSSENHSAVYSVPPVSEMDCPGTHPVKTTTNRGVCIYRVPGSELYSRTKPNQCFSTGEDAEQEGCKPGNF